MKTLDNFVEYHFNAPILTPPFIEMINSPEIDESIDGFRVPPELIIKHDLRLDHPYTTFQDFCGVTPGAEGDPQYYVKRNPVRFVKDRLRFGIWTVQSIVRIVRKLPFEAYMNNKKYPAESELAVEFHGDGISICPYKEEDVITCVRPIYCNSLHFDEMWSDSIKISFELSEFVPEVYRWDLLPDIKQKCEAKVPIFLHMQSLEKITKEDMMNINVQIYPNHTPEIFSQEQKVLLHERDIREALKYPGSWVERKDGTKLVSF